jgi:hypothetical protein
MHEDFVDFFFLKDGDDKGKGVLFLVNMSYVYRVCLYYNHKENEERESVSKYEKKERGDW